MHLDRAERGRADRVKIKIENRHPGRRAHRIERRAARHSQPAPSCAAIDRPSVGDPAVAAGAWDGPVRRRTARDFDSGAGEPSLVRGAHAGFLGTEEGALHVGAGLALGLHGGLEQRRGAHRLGLWGEAPAEAALVAWKRGADRLPWSGPNQALARPAEEVHAALPGLALLVRGALAREPTGVAPAAAGVAEDVQVDLTHVAGQQSRDRSDGDQHDSAGG